MSMRAAFGRNAVQLHAFGTVLVVVRLRLGGKDQSVIVLREIDGVALGQDLRPVAHVVLPVGGVGEFNEVAVSLPADGVEIVVVPALAVAVGR